MKLEQETESECCTEEFRVEAGLHRKKRVCEDDKNTEVLTRLLGLIAKSAQSQSLTHTGYTHTPEHTQPLCFLSLLRYRKSFIALKYIK